MTTNKDIGYEEPYNRFNPSTLLESDLWYGTRGDPEHSDIMIVGESWGTKEREYKLPFMGKSGQILEILLRETNIDINRCLFSNVVSERPPSNEMPRFFYPTKQAKASSVLPVGGLYPKPFVLDWLTKLYEQVKMVNPKLIIGLGNYTLWAFTEDCFKLSHDSGRLVPSGIGDYRGSQLHTTTISASVPFLPTYHPAATFHTYPWRAMIRHDLKVIARRAFATAGWEPPNRLYIIRPSVADVIEVLDNLLAFAALDKFLKLAVDIETRGNFIACIGIAWNSFTAICIPILTTEKGKKAGYWTMEEEFEIMLKLQELLTHPNVGCVGQNFQFDAQYIFAQMFFVPNIVDDTMLKHHCCFPGGGDPIKGTGPKGLVQKSLNHISSLYCDFHRYWKDEGKTWETWMPEERLWNYNCDDCCITYEANEKLDDVVRIQGLEEQYQFQIQQLTELAIPMMLIGVKIDLNTRNKMTMEMFDAIAEFERKIGPMAPPEMVAPPPGSKSKTPWYRSPQRLMKLFYDELGIKPVRDPNTGRPTTGKKALPILAKREPLIRPIIDAIGTLRSLNVFYSTFLCAKLDPDNRMRCSYNVAGTETFRWSSSTNVFDRGANLQNLPKGDEESKAAELIKTQGVVFPNIRKLFIPDTGRLIIEADLSGADAQVVAWETGEEKWKELLKSGVKLHSVVSKEREGTDEYPYYDMYKRRIHATDYGGGPRTLHQTIAGLYGAEYTSIARETAFQTYWFDTYPGVKDWHERIKKSLKKAHGVSNQFGNRIIFQERIDSVFTDALAWIPQSTVALVCVRGALAIKRQFKFIRILMQVHDSVIFQIPKTERKHLKEIQQVLNSITIPYDDPLQIPWSFDVSDKSWGDAE